MKLKQHLIIKQYFIDYTLGKYSDKPPVVPDYLVEELSKPNYEDQLEITKLVISDTKAEASFESNKIIAENQVYSFSKPNELDLFEAKYLDSATYPTVADIPMDIVDDLVLIEDLEGRKPVIFVSKEFKKLPVEDKFSQLIEIFKNRVRVDYSEPETILGQVFDLDKDSSWDEDLNQLVIVSAVLKGRICVVDDIRRYELQDSHIGKLTHAGDGEPTPTYSNFKVKTTTGEILELDLTNTEQVEEWVNNNYILIEDLTHEGVSYAKLKVELESVEEVISYGGPQIHIEDEVFNISGYQLGTPNLIKIPDYLPEWVTNMYGFLKGASKFNQPLDLDTSKVTNMSEFLYGATNFNSPINLDTSNVTDMHLFLYEATSFNQPINLDTSKVTDMGNFLAGASSFNQPLNLDTSNVTNMYGFLYGATSFNQPLDLDTSKVTRMDSFLYGASKFNQPLELDTSNVTKMNSFLRNATSFNQDLSHLCVPLIKSEPYNFAEGATAYTKPRPIWGTCPSKE